MTAIGAELRRVFQAAGIRLTEVQARQMERHYDCLAAENKKYNLTSITSPAEAAAKHFLDSAAPYALLDVGGDVLDVGSGGGFPALPLKIMRPDVRVTALEATAKKCDFIRKAAECAGVEVGVVNGRAEEAAHGEMRGSFDACVSRAVAKLPVLAELCAGFLKVGGKLLAYKTGRGREEAAGEYKALGLRLEGIRTFRWTEAGRCILVYGKVRETESRYPRKYAQILKRPL